MPIKRIKFSKTDIQQLASKVPPLPDPNRVLDFRSSIVQKPWGSEYLLFCNRFVEVWNLDIVAGHSTSMHCHPNKKTALVLLEGEAIFTTLEGTVKLRTMDAVVIEAGVFHQTQATSNSGARVIEVETPPAKHDLLRLHDHYGRENLAYEGRDKLLPDQGQCVRFFNSDLGGPQKQSLGSCSLVIQKIDSDYFLDTHREDLLDYELMIILEGLISKSGNDEIYGVAEILPIREVVKSLTDYQVFNLTIMGISSSTVHLSSRLGLFSKIFSRRFLN